MLCTGVRFRRASNTFCAKPVPATRYLRSAPGASTERCRSCPSYSGRENCHPVLMQLKEPKLLAALPELRVERVPGASMAGRTSLGIGGTTDILLIRRPDSLPDLISL